MKKNFNRGVGGKNQVGKSVRYDPHIRVKRFAVNLFRNGEDLKEIRKTIWNRTQEKFLLVNKRQLNGWVKIVDKLGDCVVQRTSKRVAGGGRKVRFAKYDTALYNWFCARRTEKRSVSASLLKHEAQRLAKADGYTISRRWLEKFRKRHNIVVRKVQRRTKLSDAERDARLQRFYAFLYLQPSAVRVWVNLDEIPASLGGLLGNVETLEHEGSRNVMALADENGLTMFVQSIDTALAALYRTAHHRLYAAHMEGNPKVTAAQARNLFVEFCYTGHQNAVNLLDVPTLFEDLGYIDPTKLKLRVPFQFAIPQRAEPPRGDASAPKPKPKPNPKPVSRQLSMSAFLSK